MGTDDERRTADVPDRRVREAVGRRDLLRAIGAGAIGSALLSGSVGTASATNDEETHFENPLYGPDFADPTVHRDDDGTWWAYASNMSYSHASERLVPVLSSPDLVDWTYEGEAFDSRPGWLYGSVWAPDIHYYDGQWVLFYALWPRDDDDSLVPGVGVATADTPDGPFTDHGEVFSNPDHPYPGNTIDPYFVEYDGRPYLFWANFAGVYYVELTDDLQDFLPETFGQIVGNAYEGPTIFYRDGYWYFFGATGWCCDGFESTYEVEVGRAEDLFGPYYDRDGTPMLERDEWNAGVTHLGDSERFVGPGHGDVTVDDDGTYWFLYHAYDTEGPEFADEYGWPPARQLFVDRLYWTADGWPVIGGDETPSLRSPVPNLGQRPAPVSDGTYHIVNGYSEHYLGTDGSDEGASAVVTTADTDSPIEWQVTRLDGGEYHIANLESGLALEVAEASTSDGADIQQWPWHSHPTQRWFLFEEGDGAYRLENACSASIAEVAEVSTESGANVRQWTDNGGDHQRWHVVPVDAETDGIELNGYTARDLDGDGRYRDVTGNGQVGFNDVVTFFEHLDEPAVQNNVSAFDFGDTGDIGFTDVIALFEGI
ncbi:family 43 glycosylhydrolase [Natronobiforma cellulositropha]|uniref:family 43 glycosylhydrolase n=1 Tax=Natronobiforma cellulositropha TaxID=1679076 RepID=UPI0021D5EABA|nr:family 43 glycosylhydrolase [Natronobiforma cellulositropha]